MLYPFSIPNTYGNHHFTQRHSGFSDQEIDQIREIGDALETTSVKLYGEFDDKLVKVTGAHFKLTESTRWIYEGMANAINEVNRDEYQYDLTGFSENFYYLTYREAEHFNWHLDIGEETPTPRKLSLILQLSDPAEYEGGEFDVMVTTDYVTAYRQKGLITAFPAYKIHRVRPVHSGVRRVLTAFAAGPNFR